MTENKMNREAQPKDTNCGLVKGKLIFSYIENGKIFEPEFKELTKNNEIIFSNQRIAILYGPNGTGKTSLVKAISSGDGKDVKIKYTYDGKEYTDGSQFFVIYDQNSRNIIEGEEKEFLLGDDIKREFELREYLGKEYERLCSLSFNTLKNEHKIANASSKLIECFEGFAGIEEFLKDLMNSKSKGGKFGIDKYISRLEEQASVSIAPFEKEKLDYIISDLSDKHLLIKEVAGIDTGKLTANSEIVELEPTNVALKVLNQFSEVDRCIVCDTERIDTKTLLSKKSQKKEVILKALDPKIKNTVEKIIEGIREKDPFNIKKILLSAIETGDLEWIKQLQAEIDRYKNIYACCVIQDLVKIYKNSNLKAKYDEYQKIINEKPEISDEDIIYIESIISGSMSKKLEIGRDKNTKNLRIVLDGSEFIGVERDKLPLSTGEQNFLSLTFEFLKAKNSDKQIVILDDPISSFDSIYKNKITFAIVKMLEKKDKVILTHNIDLLRLLNGQFPNCFNLYLFNNTEGEENGFISLKKSEQSMLIRIPELLKVFRKDIFDYIRDCKLFLISTIPFMRGYATFIGDKSSEEALTQVMHGYKKESVDIAEIYIKLFGDGLKDICSNYSVNVDDILARLDNVREIVDVEEYPLLNRTLIHAFTYLCLRLLVEKRLTEKFGINTDGKDGSRQLGEIIADAFPQKNKSMETTRNRVFLTSKKTLLNEFNHFEGNLSIFQPAIDISDHVLNIEKEAIRKFLKDL